MRKVVLLIALLGLFSLLTVAQETPKAEVFGGYQFTHTNIIGTGLNFNGWNASVTGNVNKWFGVAGDFSGNYHSETGGSLKVYSYTFGPVISLNHGGKLNPFVHALFGGAHANLSVNGAGSGQHQWFLDDDGWRRRCQGKQSLGGAPDSGRLGLLSLRGGRRKQERSSLHRHRVPVLTSSAEA